MTNIVELERELAAAQAREKVRIEALKFYAGIGCGDRIGMEVIRRVARTALAQPDDDTALNRLLAEGQAREKVLTSKASECYLMLLAEPNTKLALDKAESMLRELIAVKPADDTALRAALKAEREAGKLEAAQHILEMWNEPWPVSQMPFIKRLEAYVEELKCL